MRNADRNMKRSSVFMEPGLIAELQKAAKEDDRYPAEIIRYALGDWLARRKQNRGGQK